MKQPSLLFVPHRAVKAALLILTSCLVSLPLTAEDTPASRPNVLFIALDDLNHWVGHLGRNKQTKTPNIDRLAARGVSFKHAYCAAPVCNPSRAALMSGLRPGTSGVYDNNNDWREVIPEDKTLISTFRKAGYVTLGSGKIYHGGFDRKKEWDDYFKNEGFLGPVPKGSHGVGGIRFGVIDAEDSELSDYRIVDYGIEQLRKKHDKPFLLTVGLHKPHMPWFVPRKYFELHPLDQIQLPPTKPEDLADVPPAGIKFAKPDGDHKDIKDSGRWKEAVQAYLAAVSYADAQVGRLLDALDNSEHAKNTVIVLFGDHGWHFGEKEHWRKFALWEEATRAPYIWVAPGVTQPGGISERTVDFISLFPTLVDLTGIEKPAHLEGPSIRALLQDPKAAWDTPAITTFQRNNHAIRSEGWRYIHYANGDEELYDEKADPYEWTNLASDPTYAERKTELGRHLPSTNLAPAAIRQGGGGKGRNNRNRQGNAGAAKSEDE